jgi:hypothetical protein
MGEPTWIFSFAAAPATAIAGEAMAGSRSAIAPVTDKIIHFQALLAVPPAKAFAFFTANELLQSWLVEAAASRRRLGADTSYFGNPPTGRTTARLVVALLRSRPRISSHFNGDAQNSLSHSRIRRILSPTSS